MSIKGEALLFRQSSIVDVQEPEKFMVIVMAMVMVMVWS